ncbi:TPA: hypothetical protein ACH3X2_009257 [Trebouxia sp. C0005]
MVERLVEYTEQQRLQLTTHTTYQPELGTIHPAFALQHVIDELMHASQLMMLSHMLGAVQYLYAGSLLSMKITRQRGSSQSPSIGLRQGCALSATLYGMFIPYLHHHPQAKAAAAGVRV